MLILLDTANIEEIRRLNDLYPIDGVTTNPSIISKEKKPFLELIKEIQNIIGKEKMLHVQVLSLKAEKIVEEAKDLNRTIGGNIYIKIPVIPEGIKAMKILKELNIQTTATAIFTPQQAHMAAKAGAAFVAPYVNRIDNISGDGVGVVEQIIRIFNHFDMDTKVLAASFKNVDQVNRASLAGAHAITGAPDIIDGLLAHPLTDSSIEKFLVDWKTVYGN